MKWKKKQKISTLSSYCVNFTFLLAQNQMNNTFYCSKTNFIFVAWWYNRSSALLNRLHDFILLIVLFTCIHIISRIFYAVLRKLGVKLFCTKIWSKWWMKNKIIHVDHYISMQHSSNHTWAYIDHDILIKMGEW